MSDEIIGLYGLLEDLDSFHTAPYGGISRENIPKGKMITEMTPGSEMQNWVKKAWDKGMLKFVERHGGIDYYFDEEKWKKAYEDLVKHRKQVALVNVGQEKETLIFSAMADADWEAEKSMIEAEQMESAINFLVATVHRANAKWWVDPLTGLPKERNIGEALMLCVSELSEALEGDRKDLMDDKLPEYEMFSVEVIDCLIRLFDLLGGLHIEKAGEIFKKKMAYNAHRVDHKLENRILPGGKKY